MPIKNNTQFLVMFLLLLGLFSFDSVSGIEAATKKLTSIRGVYVFGDSLVDAGNNNLLVMSVAKADYPPNGIDFPNKKPTGRFCNGKNAADFIAEKFGLPLPPPYLSLRGIPKRKERASAAITGLNFASGGSGIFNTTDRVLGQAVPLSHQVNHWITINKEITSKLGQAETQIHLSESLFVVVIGSNDLFDYYGSLKLRQKTNPQQYTQSMVDKLKEQLKRLHDSGGRKFLVVGAAQIGCIPGQRKNSKINECDQKTNTWCSLYNEALQKMLQKLKEELQNSMKYSYFDTYKATGEITAHPTRYGFADATSGCCGKGKLNAEGPCLPLSKLCSDRTKYLYWDLFGHPTESAARTIVDFMLNDGQYSFPETLSQLVSS